MAEEKKPEFEDMPIAALKLKNKEKKMLKKMEQNIQELWDNYTRSNTCTMGILEEEKEKITGNIWSKSWLRTSPELLTDTKPQIRKLRVHRTGQMPPKIIIITLHLNMFYPNCIKSEMNRKFWKKPEENSTIPIEEQK